MCKYCNRVSWLRTICFVGLFCIGESSAQSPVAPALPATDVAKPAASTSPIGGTGATTQSASQPVDKADYILGTGDRLSIRVFGADDLSNLPVDVTGDGDIIAPMVGRINVGGMSIHELESALTQKYSQFYKNPQVTVTIIEYRGEPVTVVGSVNTPGVIQLRRPTRLMEVISEAGGLRADAGDRAFITRKSSSGDTSGTTNGQAFTTQSVDLRKIIEGQNPAMNVLVQSNDLVTIPKAKMVYVVGDVGRPGGYVLDGHGSAITVLQAIALAGGVNRTAKTTDSRILQAGTDESHRIETTINVKKILANQAPDVELHAEDILFVPNSAAKTAGIRTLEMAADITTGMAIWRF